MSTATLDALGVSLSNQTIREFLKGEIGPESLPVPQWGPIGEEVFDRTYARDIGDRKECWGETVRRVVNGNLGYLDKSMWLDNEDVDLFRLLYTFQALPAGRHLWVTGTEVASMKSNCFVAGFGPRTSDHFAFLASRLFEGGGVGSNYSQDLIAVTEPSVAHINVQFICNRDHADYGVLSEFIDMNLTIPQQPQFFFVEDTREGWVDVWARLIDLSTVEGLHNVVVDVSDLRPHGAPLLTFGGKASGPAPLVAAIKAIVAVLNGAKGRRLTGLETMVIDHEIAASIVSGGARRSARMSMMHWRDPEVFKFLACKSDPSKHWSTNISVEIDDEFLDALNSFDDQANRVLAAVAHGMVTNGEPGFINTALHSADEPEYIRVTNPCGEASLTTNRETGAGESCNLGSVDLDSFGTDIVGAAKAFYMMGRFLYRATLNPHKDAEVASIEFQNRRIGVGLMGLQGWCAAHGIKLSDLPNSPNLLGKLTKFRQIVRFGANTLADDLGLPRSVKVTAVAPTGTIAQLRGTQSSIQPVYAKYFIRRVRYTDIDLALLDLAEQGYTIVDDVYAANTKVVEFIVKDSILDRYDPKLIEQSDELSVDQFFAIVASVQASYCGTGDGQAISATGQIPEGSDPELIVQAVYKYARRLKGITVFPNKSRELQPISPLSEGEYMERSVRTPVLVSDSNDGECVGGSCPIR